MKLFLKLTDLQESSIDRNLDLILRAKNKNVLDLWFIDEDCLPVDITDGEIFFTVKDKVELESGESAILEKTITSFLDSQNGNAQIELTEDETATLEGNYFYSIEIQLESAHSITVLEGQVCFQKSLRE